MKYYIIHVKHRRRDGEGYSVIISIESGGPSVAVEQMINKGYFDWIEDIYDIGYTSEITKEEYEKLTEQSHMLWENGCLLGDKIFSAEDFAKAKRLSYENWKKESTDIGFEYIGQWITNPFIDASGRFELEDIQAMYDYYSKDADNKYECGAKEKVYRFILSILGMQDEEASSEKIREMADTGNSTETLPFDNS